jgi:hypothetical protein
MEADIGAFWETYEAAKTCKDGKLETDQEGKMLTVSHAELIAQLSDQANQLGVKIDQSYSFAQQQKPDDEPQG